MKLSQIHKTSNTTHNLQASSAQPLFIFKEITGSEDSITEKSSPQNLIIFIINGSIRITSDNNTEQIIPSGRMFSIAKSFTYRITTDSYCKLLLFHFEHIHDTCPKLFIDNDIPAEQSGQSLKIKKPIQGFIDLIETYKTTCSDYELLYNLKKNEFFILLNLLYSKEDLTLLLYPIIKHSSVFKQFVLTHCDKVNNVTEMIESSNLSKSTFYCRFKKEFGIPAKQWMVNRLKHEIQRRATTPEITAKTLMNEFKFSSPEHFNSFCKKQFGMTPSQLIKSQISKSSSI